MSVDEFIAVAESIRFEPPHIPLRFRVSRRIAFSVFPEEVSISFELRAPDVDKLTQPPGFFTKRVVIPRDEIVAFYDKARVIHRIRAELEEILTHELGEWFFVGSERPFYPHRNGDI